MTSAPPDTINIPQTTAQEIVNLLEEHVGGFCCEHDIGLCFCREREIIALLKDKLEQEQFRIVYG